MSIFSSILDKLGIHKPAAPVAPAVPAATPPPFTSGPMHEHFDPPATMPTTPATPAKPDFTPGHGYEPPALVTPAKPAEMAMVDVVSHLDYLAKTGPIQGLNWRMSINDLMALLGLDHSPQAIRDLAVELGCPEKEMGDSYSRNVWTHQTLLKKIAENGGNIPPELLH
jgi:hypothetical protein